jgi:transposase
MRDRQPQTALYVGIDVSKDTLTLATDPTTQVWDIPNQPDAWHALATQLRALSVQRVLLESSGGYEQGVVQTLQQAGLPVVVPAQRARYFARSLRGNLKTDRVDAQLLAYFACCYPAPEATEVPEGQAQLRALGARREQLVEALEAEKKRLSLATVPVVRATLEQSMAHLEALLAQIEAAVAALVAADEALSQKAALLQTAVGVGAVVAYGLLAELPELGQVSREAIAALAGLAPVCRESGSWRGYARIGGGHWRVRRLLYVAAVVAVSHDARWRAVYEGLLAKGKPKKVALCAVARRLLVVLNAMVRDGRCYERA